jgi:hypothetical protein
MNYTSYIKNIFRNLILNVKHAILYVIMVLYFTYIKYFYLSRYIIRWYL